VEGSGRLRTGVWIIEESGRVDIVKRAKSSIVKDSAVLASFLLRSDIEGLLEQQRIPYERAEFAYNLREKIKVVNLALLRDAALTSFKNRFRERSLNLIARIQENQE
jgi:hypothetical protein